MTLAEMLPSLAALTKDEKGQVIDLLSSQVAEPTLAEMFPSGKVLEIWSPYESYEAAHQLEQMLEARKREFVSQ